MTHAGVEVESMCNYCITEVCHASFHLASRPLCGLIKPGLAGAYEWYLPKYNSVAHKLVNLAWWH